MWATEYGSYNKRHYFNPDDIACIVEDCLNCKTYFNNGQELSLSWRDMKQLLKQFPQVYSHEVSARIYINPKSISNYTAHGFYVEATLTNGVKLMELSRADFEKNVVSKFNQGIELNS